MGNALRAAVAPAELQQRHFMYHPCCQVKAGTLVLLHHSLVHYSKGNTSDKSRHAYSIHVVEGKDGYKYPEDNWLQRPGDAPFHELP